MVQERLHRHFKHCDHVWISFFQDLALRKLQQEMTLPGEAQKIEKVVEVFSKRYIQCNQVRKPFAQVDAQPQVY